LAGFPVRAYEPAEAAATGFGDTFDSAHDPNIHAVPESGVTACCPRRAGLIRGPVGP